MCPNVDESLLARVLEYDPSALGEIYDLYAPHIYHYVAYRVGDARLAEDLTSQCFTKMLEAIQSGKTWQSSFVGWLYRIAHNLVMDHYRRHDGQVILLDDLFAGGDWDPMRTAESNLENDRLHQAIAQLPEGQSQVILLKFVEGFSNAEVGEILGKSEGAIKSLQFRALATLQRMLEEEQVVCAVAV